VIEDHVRNRQPSGSLPELSIQLCQAATVPHKWEKAFASCEVGVAAVRTSTGEPSLKTKSTVARWQVLVLDEGAGFDPAPALVHWFVWSRRAAREYGASAAVSAVGNGQAHNRSTVKGRTIHRPLRCSVRYRTHTSVRRST
jgi:hypothetical protein